MICCKLLNGVLLRFSERCERAPHAEGQLQGRVLLDVSPKGSPSASGCQSRLLQAAHIYICKLTSETTGPCAGGRLCRQPDHVRPGTDV